MFLLQAELDLILLYSSRIVFDVEAFYPYPQQTTLKRQPFIFSETMNQTSFFSYPNICYEILILQQCTCLIIQICRGVTDRVMACCCRPALESASRTTAT